MPGNINAQSLSDHWRQHTEDWSHSGLGQQAYCRKQGLKYHQFHYWRKKLSRTSHKAPAKHPRKPREGFLGKLPRVRVEILLSEQEKVGATQSFFSKVKEELDIIPAKARVIEYWQEKAVFDQPGGAVRLRHLTG